MNESLNSITLSPSDGNHNGHAVAARAPLQISGIFPSLAQIADFGPPRSECGIGGLMPWNGKLYVLNYVSHRSRSGTGTGFRVIDENFQMLRHPAGVDGTYANRMVHYESNQLIFGPHVIDKFHNVRTVPELIDIRLAGCARHLSDPANWIYLLGMEGELVELNVHTLQVNHLFDLTQELDTPGEMKCHFKDCYTAFGRLVICNNDYEEGDFKGERSEGTLAEYDGEKWTVLERKPFVCVHGRGNFADTIFALGWDSASSILKVFTNNDKQWKTYRLPKASHTFDHKWQTEWPRIREVEHERFLMDCHGMFYELSPWAYGGKIWGVRPISTHLWVHGDFCSWRGMLVLGADNASPAGGSHNILCAEPQSGLWFGKTDDLWNFGKPTGWGGPWWKSEVTANEPSDPYLMTGFDKKSLHLFHESEEEINFTIEVDPLGDGSWQVYESVKVAPQKYFHHEFPSGFSAHWLRVTADKNCVATAHLHYT